jgi:sporadic carbohydrate cluster 2OG-Fe(II) oxygenase
MFLTESEQQLTQEFLENGYVIRPVADLDALNWMREQLIMSMPQADLPNIKAEPQNRLNNIHKFIPAINLNAFRVQVINAFNSVVEFREMYYKVARPYLEALVGNELAMQTRINLSIQMPQDNSSLLPIHADTWSGDSPYEVVVWLPFVDCFQTKAMYILPTTESNKFNDKFLKADVNTSEDLYQSIQHEIKWLNIKYGEVLIFDQALPHGNRINEEGETRWSMNCRFKGVFTPYGDKKIGEFFDPITLRAASRNGMKYKLPKIK